MEVDQEAVDAFADAQETFEEGDSDALSFPLHRAAYYNDAARIRQLAAAGLGAEDLQQQDPHGNSALHVAALRRSTAAVEALLAAGLPVDAKSRRGWTALEESLAARDHATAKVLHAATLAASRGEMKTKRRQLLAAMRGMPDYTMRLGWRLDSSVPGLGALLRRYAPADTYTLWKVGDRLRVDGSLMGVDVKSPGLIPGWKRGHFSLVMDGSGCGTQESADGAGAAIALGKCGSGSMDAAGSTGCSDGGPAAQAAAAAPRLLFLHHGKQRWVDLGADKKAMKAEESAALEEELLAALERDVDKQRFKVRGFRFEPLRGWLGGEVREKVEGWACRVYEAAGKLVGVATSKAAWQLEGGAAFEDYLALDPPDDDVAEAGFDPLNPGSYDPSSGRAARGGDADYAEAEASAVGGEEEEEEEEEQDAAAVGEGEGGGEGGGSRSKNGSGAAWGGGGGGINGRAEADANVRVDDGAAAVEAAPSPQSRQRQRTSPGLGPRPPRQRSPSRKGKAGGRAAGGRTLRARLWMASGFPMRLSELVPLLGVVGAANKQIARVGRFMARYSGLDLFPVRIQVPLLLTVYAVVGFSAFKELTPADAPGPEFFQVPEGYQRRRLNEMLDKNANSLLGAGPSARRGRGGEDDFDGFGDDLEWL